jgi:hypothetical protein
MAQPTTPVVVTGVPGFTKLSDAVIAEFKANPISLLTSYAAGGLTLSAQVRNLALSVRPRTY